MKKQITYSNFLPRIFASVLDLLILSIINQIISYGLINYGFRYLAHTNLIQKIEHYLSNNLVDKLHIPLMPGELKMATYYLLIAIIMAVILISYFIAFWYFYSATPGKMIMHIKIADAKTFKCPNLWQCFFRFSGYLFTILGIWFILFNERKRALNDFIAGTVVIKK